MKIVVRTVCILLFVAMLSAMCLSACGTNGNHPENSSNSEIFNQTDLNNLYQLLPVPDLDAFDAPVLPEVRISEYIWRGDMEIPWTVDEKLQSADAIAHVRIHSFLSSDGNYSTYQAETIQVFAGELPDIFALEQFGSVEGSCANFPTYTYGNEMVLFLNRHKNPHLSEDVYENTYGAIADDQMIFDVVENDSGEKFLSCRSRKVGEIVAFNISKCEDVELLSMLKKNLIKNDFIWEELEYPMEHVFRYEDFQKYIENERNIK